MSATEVRNLYGRWLFEHEEDEKWDKNEFRHCVFFTELKEERHELTKKYFDTKQDIELIFKSIIKTKNIEVVKDFFDFIIGTNLIDKNDNIVQDIVKDIYIENHFKYDNHIDDLKVKEYIICNIFNVDTIKNTIDEDELHIFGILCAFSYVKIDDEVNKVLIRVFDYLDSIGYVFIKDAKLLQTVIHQNFYVLVPKLVEKGFDINDEEISKCILQNIAHLNEIKDFIIKCNTEINKLDNDDDDDDKRIRKYKYESKILNWIYNNDEIIKDLFTEVNLSKFKLKKEEILYKENDSYNRNDAKQAIIRYRKLTEIIKNFDFEENSDDIKKKNKSDLEDYFYSSFRCIQRYRWILKKEYIENHVIIMLQTTIGCGYKPTKSIKYDTRTVYEESMTPLEFYNFGCKPVMILHPEIHQQITKLLTPVVDIVI